MDKPKNNGTCRANSEEFFTSTEAAAIAIQYMDMLDGGDCTKSVNN